MDQELLNQVKPLLNDVCSHLSVGAIWHRQAANESRQFFITQGWSQWHDVEATCDDLSLGEFTKMVSSKLKYRPVVDTASTAKAQEYRMVDFEAFKGHHMNWIAREERFIATLNDTRPFLVDLNMELYECVCNLLKEVQNEKLNVELVNGSCTMTGWNPHDVKVTSKWLQDYFELEYKGGPINFNIG